jgi:hypothetical protein
MEFSGQQRSAAQRLACLGVVCHRRSQHDNDAQYTIANPAVTFQQTTNRTWTDADGDFVADCVLTNSAGNGECGPWQNLNFGNPFNTTTVNPAVLEGWGVRPYDWQFGVTLQQEILPRVSVDVSYNRRWWGNHFFTDNRAIGPQDFDVLTITAPRHPELEGGGGYPVTFVSRNTRSRWAPPTTTTRSPTTTAT